MKQYRDIPLDVFSAFERLALAARAAGYSRYSADAVLHRVRWEAQIERGNRAFVCNNNWTSVLARWFMRKHPEADGFFELRASPNRTPHT
ncbi:MAG: hypothetical protein HXX10_07345 [Rhodoplanes sp.]|uniref:hypothetical protein n=1 Tax=Rhodoplanes sp. TaxID=1968906 RepID=UPI001822748B|nr:hypothetical protein [Rhodoplanes sp.]NVO13834.1 hypothetical protein [Rhodoplanes sp.]